MEVTFRYPLAGNISSTSGNASGVNQSLPGDSVLNVRKRRDHVRHALPGIQLLVSTLVSTVLQCF